ncbi:MAG: hypothetical protein DCC50_04960 [Acidobacteria bacterium]|nr:MAG: hypothetical protein DCC50_04960 [Acidobacteriota bacterium]
MEFEVRRSASASWRRLRRSSSRIRRRAARTFGGTLSRPRELLTAAPVLRDLAGSAEDREITAYRGRLVISRRQRDVTVWRLAADTATAVAAALDRAGVEYFAMHPPYARVARWGVPRRQLDTAVRALVRALGEQGFYYTPQSRSDHPRLLIEGVDPDALEGLRGLTVFQYVRCTTTGKLYGAPDGCRIAVWDQHPDRPTLLAPDRRSTVQEIDDRSPLQLATRERWDGRSEPVVARTLADASTVEFPIDAVYLWVDDSDPRWRARRAAVRTRLGLDTSTPPAAHQFRDRGELRASMRSLEMYAPWIRHIYLVTDDQRPAWLIAPHSRVTVVDHQEIFADPGALPTYNSHAIGSQVHRIPGLSDHYLLMNDDVMFTRPVSPDDFFTPTGQLKVAFSRSRRPDIAREHQTALEQARTNSAELLERDFGRRASRLFAHAPVPQRRDVAREVAERYAEEIATTVRSPFRAATDVVPASWLNLYTALLTGRATRSSLRFGYYNVGEPTVRARLDARPLPGEIKVICLNDVPPRSGEEDADPEWLSGWLGRRFPIPAPFELPMARGSDEESADPAS